MNNFLTLFPSGHYYSPIPSGESVTANYARYRHISELSCVGIDLRAEQQLELLQSLRGYFDECPFPDTQTPPFRFYFENPMFSYGDAATLYAMIRHLCPRKIIEIGSGFSTAVMVDTVERFLKVKPSITAIEPSCERLRHLYMEQSEQLSILESRVEDVPLAMFSALEAGDILFIDSSHIVKFGSEVPYIISGILPRLQRGVVVHIHDIFWPFEYSKEWLERGLAFNEAYLVRAFLQGNKAFQIVLFNDWLASKHYDQLHSISRKNSGGSLWLEKVED